MTGFTHTLAPGIFDRISISNFQSNFSNWWQKFLLQNRWQVIDTAPHTWQSHDDVIKWKHLPSYWPFVWGIHRCPVNSPHKGALMFSLICVWINGWVNNREAGYLRRYPAHYDAIVMNIGSGNDLVPSGNVPLPENVDPDLCHYMVSLSHNALTCKYK